MEYSDLCLLLVDVFKEIFFYFKSYKLGRTESMSGEIYTNIENLKRSLYLFLRAGIRMHEISNQWICSFITENSLSYFCG